MILTLLNIFVQFRKTVELSRSFTILGEPVGPPIWAGVGSAGGGTLNRAAALSLTEAQLRWLMYLVRMYVICEV